MDWRFFQLMGDKYENGDDFRILSKLENESLLCHCKEVVLIKKKTGSFNVLMKKVV